jgi:hypothetical protein
MTESRSQWPRLSNRCDGVKEFPAVSSRAAGRVSTESPEVDAANLCEGKPDVLQKGGSPWLPKL